MWKPLLASILLAAFTTLYMLTMYCMLRANSAKISWDRGGAYTLPDMCKHGEFNGDTSAIAAFMVLGCCIFMLMAC